MNALALALNAGPQLKKVAMVLQENFTFSQCIGAFETIVIEAALEAARGNKCLAARRLGMHRNTLDRHIASRNIDYLKFRHPGERRSESYASKERPASGDLAAARPALAPVLSKEERKRRWDEVKLLKHQPRRPRSVPGGNSSAAQGQREVNDTRVELDSAPGGFTNSVRKGGRGESPEPPRGSVEVPAKLPRGEKIPDLVECGGLKA